MFEIYNHPEPSLWKTVGRKLGIGLLAYGALVQTANSFNQARNYVNPSEIRQNFERELGIPINGWPKEIEYNPVKISQIAREIAKERSQTTFDIRSVNLEPEAFVKNDLFTQLVRLISTDYSGYANPLTDNVVLAHTADYKTFEHEIMHAATFDVLRRNPEFKEEWKKLAVDSAGNSLYLNTKENVFTRLKVLNRLVDRKKQNSDENQRLGFVSNYARTNFYEDVAELTGGTGSFINFETKFIGYLVTTPNPIVQKKVRLAEKYGLIPKGFEEYVELMALMRDVYPDRWMDKPNAEKFLEKSRLFIDSHPNSPYEGELRMVRGGILHRLSYMNRDDPGIKEKSLNEYAKALELSPKSDIYSATLFKLSEIHLNWGNYAEFHLFRDAYEEYYRRYRSGDVSILRTGVDDFLKSKDIETGRK